MRYFISGHRDLTIKEFEEHYVPQINKVLVSDSHAHFKIGDWEGCDNLAFNYILKRINRNQLITIYCVDQVRLPKYSEQYPNIISYKYKTYDECDASMTYDSEFDIAWIRPGRENSHTANNIRRRYGL